MVIHARARTQVGKMAASPADAGIAEKRQNGVATARPLADRRHIREGYSGDPEVGYPLDDVVALLEVGLAQLVILLLDLEDLVAGLLVQAIDLILAAVDLLEGLLYLDVPYVILRVPLARARVLQLLRFLVGRRHRCNARSLALSLSPRLRRYYTHTHRTMFISRTALAFSSR